MARVLWLAVCGEGPNPRVSRVVRARSGLGLDVYSILFISTVTVLLSLLSIEQNDV